MGLGSKLLLALMLAMAVVVATAGLAFFASAELEEGEACRHDGMASGATVVSSTTTSSVELQLGGGDDDLQAVGVALLPWRRVWKVLGKRYLRLIKGTAGPPRAGTSPSSRGHAAVDDVDTPEVEKKTAEGARGSRP
ncbi:hypothetical protein GUJ93_ZPchr0006g42765 [Zizania palustris]|uniref:Uncharacterized protein n=1 Tax=Zizania palustris TaxID=103762 RepID=A0A8J5S7U7_ZIZPA|nr:hypothetical protein GUJ93_ZPchr0006g42765 [Zizania palustris]